MLCIDQRFRRWTTTSGIAAGPLALLPPLRSFRRAFIYFPDTDSVSLLNPLSYRLSVPCTYKGNGEFFAKLMLTDKQARFVKYLLGKKGYYSEDWAWLGSYTIKAAGKLIDKLLNDGPGSAAFIATLPPPVEKRRKQAWLPLPDSEPLPLPPDLPPELAEFKRWAREVFARGELTMQQLCELHDGRFGKPVI